MSSTRSDKENDSDEHLSNKRNRVSRFPSLKEADLAGGCEDEKPAAKKKQKIGNKDDYVDDPLKEFNCGSNYVPKKSRKKKGGRGTGTCNLCEVVSFIYLLFLC